jgi:hypothetical protein
MEKNENAQIPAMNQQSLVVAAVPIQLAKCLAFQNVQKTRNTMSMAVIFTVSV